MAPPVEQLVWTPEPRSTFWDKLETCAGIQPKPQEAKGPMGVLKYWGKFVQAPQQRSKEWLFHAGCMTECLLFTYKVAKKFENNLKRA